MRVSGGIKEKGVVVGNNYDKYGSNNFIVKKIMKGFHDSLDELVGRSAPNSIHEVGCGEGFWVLKWNEQNIDARGSDFSSQVIGIARDNALCRGFEKELFNVRSIYDLDQATDQADLIVCCEVLEHLDDPVAGLKALQKVVHKDLILSVPREPVWCALNLCRGKYITDFGNTPGHLQHWSKRAFVNLVSNYFHVTEVRNPFPWTMLLCRSKA